VGPRGPNARGTAELAQAGLDPATALHSPIVIGHFVTGFVLEEQAAAGRAGPVTGPAEAYPLLSSAPATGGPPESDRAFEHGLGSLIVGLARHLPGQGEGTASWSAEASASRRTRWSCSGGW
jgi:TetR/AcrR family tetracycline transcriptional repressor